MRGLILLLVGMLSYTSGFADEHTQPNPVEHIVGEYKEARKNNDVNWETWLVYLNGAGAGYQVANIFIIRETKKGYYCPPAKLSLSGYNYAQLIDDYLKKHPVSDETHISIALALALDDAFPCK
jgi:hypothetical protein